MNLENDLIKIVKRVVQTEKEVMLESELKSIGINSLMLIKIIVELEKHFDIEFDDEALLGKKYETLGDIFTYLIAMTDTH